MPREEQTHRTATPLSVVRFATNPVIRPEMLPGGDGANICGPSIIRAPAWLPKPLGRYYMYFADHKGTYIRLAHADRIEGPWTVYAPGTLRMDDMVEVARQVARGAGADPDEIQGQHIASPDVHVDEARREIRMYFHFKMTPKDAWGHKSGVALSADGIHFRPVATKPIGEPYLRVFRRDGYYYAVTRTGGVARSRDGLGEFTVENRKFAEAIPLPSRTTPMPAAFRALARQGGDDDEGGNGQIRHTALKLDGDLLTVFFSRGGELPEILLCSTARLTGDWTNWRLSPPTPVLRPEMEYEGAGVAPKSPSHPELRTLPRPLFNELRDPCIFRDGGRTYLFYSVAGERGIAGAEILE